MEFLHPSFVKNIRPPTTEVEGVNPAHNLDHKQEMLMIPDPTRPILKEEDFYKKVETVFGAKYTCINKFDNPFLMFYMATTENAEESVRRELYARIELEHTTAANVSDEFDKRHREAMVEMKPLENVPIEQYLNIPNLCNAKNMEQEMLYHKRHQYEERFYVDCDVCMALQQNQKQYGSKKRHVEIKSNTEEMDI